MLTIGMIGGMSWECNKNTRLIIVCRILALLSCLLFLGSCGYNCDFCVKQDHSSPNPVPKSIRYSLSSAESDALKRTITAQQQPGSELLAHALYAGRMGAYQNKLGNNKVLVCGYVSYFNFKRDYGEIYYFDAVLENGVVLKSNIGNNIKTEKQPDICLSHGIHL